MIAVDGFVVGGEPFEVALDEPMTEVTVTHPLGRRPASVMLIDPAGEVVDPDWSVQPAFPFAVTARFDLAESGTLIIA